MMTNLRTRLAPELSLEYGVYASYRSVPDDVLNEVGRWIYKTVSNRVGTKDTISIIDIGAGYGHFSLPVILNLIEFLSNEGRSVNVLAIDYDSERLKVYNVNIPVALREHFTIVEGDYLAVQTDETFDIALAFWFFNYCDSSDAAIQKTRALLKSTGLFIVPVADDDLPETLLEKPHDQCRSSFFSSLKELSSPVVTEGKALPASDYNGVVNSIHDHFGPSTLLEESVGWRDPLEEEAYLDAFEAGTFASYRLVPQPYRVALATAMRGRRDAWDLSSSKMRLVWRLLCVGPVVEGSAALPVGPNRESRPSVLHDAFGLSWELAYPGARLFRATELKYPPYDGIATISDLSPLFISGVMGREHLLARFILYLALLERYKARPELEQGSLSIAALTYPIRKAVQRIILRCQDKAIDRITVSFSHGSLTVQVPAPSPSLTAHTIEWLRMWETERLEAELVKYQSPERLVRELIALPTVDSLLTDIEGEILRRRDEGEAPAYQHHFTREGAEGAISFLLYAWSMSHFREGGSLATEIRYSWHSEARHRDTAIVLYSTYDVSIPKKSVLKQLRSAELNIRAYLGWDELDTETETVLPEASTETGSSKTEERIRTLLREMLRETLKKLGAIGIISEAVYETHAHEQSKADMEILSQLVERNTQLAAASLSVILRALSENPGISSETQRMITELIAFQETDEAPIPSWLPKTLRKINRSASS